MRVLLALLSVGIVGCGSGTEPAKTPAAKTPDAAAVKKQMTPAQLALGDPVVNSIGMLLVPIPTGEFMMGSGVSAADLAKRTGLPIVPVVIVPSRRWLLRSTWDRFQIPQPFSTIRVFFGEPVYARADETARSLCDRVHTALMELERGHDPSEWQQIHDRT